MSLKAKLEAVIYAAEEPVTLAQLAGLFADDALAWKAERAAAQTELALGEDDSAVPAESREPTEESEASDLSDSSRELADLVEAVEGIAPVEGADLAGDQSTLQADIHADEADQASEVEASESGPDMGSEERGGAQTAVPGTVVSEIDASDNATPQIAEATAAVDPELEIKRQERKRDREVREILRGILDELVAGYANAGRGIEIREIAGGFRMGTKPEIHDAVRSFVRSLKPALKLSLPALETLAVIAYKQPVTAPEVGEIRGVDSAGVLGSLMSRKLITTAGRKPVIGRPMLYKTTKEFLLRFGLKDVNELPSMEEFEKIAALELIETEEAEAEGEREAVAASGDLFAPPEAVDAEDSESSETEDAEIEASARQAPELQEQDATAVFTPTAEPSEEAAAEHALVERQDAEEVEAER